MPSRGKRGYGYLPPTPVEIGEARVVLRVVVHRRVLCGGCGEAVGHQDDDQREP